MVNGVERMQRMYAGDLTSGVSGCTVLFSRISMLAQCRSGLQILFGERSYRAQVQVNIARMHDVDSLYIWNRGKRRDWLNDYRLTEEGNEVYIREVKEQRKLPLSRDGYVILYPDKLPSASFCYMW